MFIVLSSNDFFLCSCRNIGRCNLVVFVDARVVVSLRYALSVRENGFLSGSVVSMSVCEDDDFSVCLLVSRCSLRSADMLSLFSIGFVFSDICGCRAETDITVPPGSLPMG